MRHLYLILCVLVVGCAVPEKQMGTVESDRAYKQALIAKYSALGGMEIAKKERTKGFASTGTVILYQTDSLGNIQYHKPALVIKK